MAESALHERAGAGAARLPRWEARRRGRSRRQPITTPLAEATVPTIDSSHTTDVPGRPVLDQPGKSRLWAALKSQRRSRALRSLLPASCAVGRVDVEPGARGVVEREAPDRQHALAVVAVPVEVWRSAALPRSPSRRGAAGPPRARCPRGAIEAGAPLAASTTRTRALHSRSCR